MRTHTLRVLSAATLSAVTSAILAGCMATQTTGAEAAKHASEDLSGNWGGGGGQWSGGGSQWGGGGDLFAGGSGFWSGGSGYWSGGSGIWGGGGGQWGGGGNFWSGGGGSYAGGGSYWGGGAGVWAGGGGFWSGGGGWWGGGGSTWGGGSGLWSGGYATAFPFIGWSSGRQWTYRGVPKPGYSPASFPTFSVAQDTNTCGSGQVRLGGFAYPIDVDGWPGFIALGYNKALCIPTPGGGGLTMNATLGASSLTPTGLLSTGGYNLVAGTTNVSNDASAMKNMVGWGTGNIATQYGGALCASIGTLAAAKRNCGVGIAFSDPNTFPDGTLTQRGITMNAAQAGSYAYRTPFGRAEGWGLYGVAAGDMESYVNLVLRDYNTTAADALPQYSSATGINGWNDTLAATTSSSWGGSDFAKRSLSASPNPTKLQNDDDRSLTSPLNMIPVDPSTSTSAHRVLSTDMANSLAQNIGDLYPLNLASVALHQSPLYGSGAGRWFFHNPSDPNAANLPLMDLSSIFQGSMYVLTGRLSGLPSAATTVSQPYVSNVDIRYADFRPEPSGTLYISRAGQLPTTVTSDDDKEFRLNAALALQRPFQNIGGGIDHMCAIASAGGALRCWGKNDFGQLGDGTTTDTSTSTVTKQVSGLTSGIVAVAGGKNHTCALTQTGGVKCWGDNTYGQIGNGVTTGGNQLLPTDVSGLTSGVAALASGKYQTCALMKTGNVKCWGKNDVGQLGNGSTTDSSVPVDVSLNTTVLQVAGAGDAMCVLTGARGVKCWGQDQDGQLGDGLRGSGTYSAVPVDATGLTSGVATVQGGYHHTCAITISGGLKCWGNNEHGEVGNGTVSSTSADITTPTDVVGLTSGVVAVAGGGYHTCALTVDGAVKCWGWNNPGTSCAGCGIGAVGNGSTTTDIPSPTQVSGLTSGVASLAMGEYNSCARLLNGGIVCWGSNSDYQLADGTGTDRQVPTAVSTASGPVSNGSPHASQGSVLIHMETSASGPVAGHITPIPWSMTKTSTGKQALFVTYNPLAAAAAIFIEQYDAHVAACNNTGSESMTEADQQAGTKLWACSNSTNKSAYLAGLKTLLNGARHYLFGNDTGCIVSTQTVDGSACATTSTGPDPMHLPYTFVVPNYTTSAYDSNYYSSLASALSTYRGSIIGSAATRLERTLQLAGIQQFTTNDAVVTSRVVRPVTDYSTLDCIANDGFAAGPPAPGVALSFISDNPSAVTGGTSSTGTVRVNVAPTSSISIALVSNNANATVPSSVSIPAGATSANFTITTSAVTANTVATITATYKSVKQSTGILLHP